MKESLSIKLKLHGRIRSAVGLEEIDIPDKIGTVGELLQELDRKLGSESSRYIFDPATNQLRPTLVILVNGHSVKMLQGLNTALNEHDTVIVDSIDIVETVGGG